MLNINATGEATSVHLERNGYANPPVLEVVIDIRVTRPDGFDAGALVSIQDYAGQRYPDTKRRKLRKDDTLTGIRIEQGNWVLQARPHAFVFSMLRPYAGWDSLFPIAVDLWQAYLACGNPDGITRVAVRSINRIKMPEGTIDLTEYFNVYPHGPTSFATSGLSEFFMQVVIPQEHLESQLIITQRSEAEEGAILLDLDLSHERVSDPWLVEHQNLLWDLVRRFRSLKNEVFESCLTDKTRELFA